MSIPHIVHQIWLQGHDQVPGTYLYRIDAWRRHHPGWRHILWDDSRIAELLERRYSWFLPTYRRYRHLHQKVDAARYFILYSFGGVYADIDTEPVRPLDGLLAEFPDANLIVPRQPFTAVEHTAIGLMLGSEYVLTNSVIAGAPGFSAWRPVLRALPRRRNRFRFMKEANVTFSTGPAFLTQALAGALRGDRSIVTVPSFYFEADRDRDRWEHYDRRYVTHTQDATWHSPALRLILQAYARVVRFLDRRTFERPHTPSGGDA